MSNIPNDTRQEQKQAGMVAIMVTMILMIVISLIVLGFAQISRRNQRQALDRQLSTQAFYAAETGVNDVVKLIKDAAASGATVAAKPDCASTGGGFYSLSPVLDAANRVQYTCVMVDPTPPSLSYSNIDPRSTVVPVIATSGTIADITLTWRAKDLPPSTPSNPNPVATDNCPTSTAAFSISTSWQCGYGVLRFDLVPTTGSGLSMSGLQNATMTSFLVPLKPGSSGSADPINYTTGGGNSKLGVVCTNDNCSYTIHFPSPQSQYYLRISSIYKNVSLEIAAKNSSGGVVNLTGAQAVVDSTGKAQDVLRRIQVRIPLTNSSSNLMGDYALQSAEALCKRFTVMDGFFQSDANNAVPGVASSTSNPYCQ